MHTYIHRNNEKQILDRFKKNPVVAILGPRQCGKSTLARRITSTMLHSLYLDLENPAELTKLADPVAFFELNKNRPICLDEIQRLPEIFPLIRSIVDRSGSNGQFLVLGSASRDLLRQGSESLAGRISFVELSPFTLSETGADSMERLRTLWLRGGFPRSFLAGSDADSFQWRADFIRTFLERDIPQLGFRIPSVAVRRLWTMCAHLHGQVLNASRLGDSLGVSHHTVRNHLDLLEKTFMVRILQPHETNLKKRLVKSPKIYIRDSGIVHALLDIRTHNDLLGNPVYGASWEGFVIENIAAELPEWRPGFYRSASGNEIDLVITRGNRSVAVECKASSTPSPGRGLRAALDDLGIAEAWIVAPVDAPYPAGRGVTVSPLPHFLHEMRGRD